LNRQFAALLMASATFSTGPVGPGLQQTREVVVIDFGADGICLTSLDSGVALSGPRSGTKLQVAWTCPGGNDAFVCFDPNANGRVDSIAELVGGGLGPPNGFDYLAALDGRPVGGSRASQPGSGRPDGVLDSRDAIFDRLILWTDSNRDGVSQEPELQSLSFAGFTSLDLANQVVPAAKDLEAGAPWTRRTTALRTSAGGTTRVDVFTIRLATRGDGL